MLVKDILAVDVGATKLAAARVTSAGVIKKRASTPTQSSNGEELFEKLLSLSEEVLEGIEVEDLKQKVLKEKPSPNKMHPLKPTES